MTTLLSDRYAVRDLIGAGGTARVHVATDRVLGRRVAVKVLDDGIAKSADPAGRARFLAEVRTAATIAHPNLVTVYDAGEDGGELFLVMEYVEGVTLAEHIARHGPLPVAEARSIAAQMLDGLAAVHRHGTVHRDVKPANVLVGDDGRVRLADFGIAKRLDEIDAAVTTAGTLVGSPSYLAPEQATGGPLSAATDVYQVGLVLHEMLTGARHGGATPAAAASAGPADPRRVRPEVPAALAAVVTRATAPDPAARYGSAEAMRAALDERHTLAMPTAPATTVFEPVSREPLADTGRRHGLLAAVVIGAAVLLLVGLAALSDRDGAGTELLPGPTTVPVVPTTAAPAPTIELTVPPTTTPTEPEPPRDNGKRNGTGNGKPNGKPKDD